MLTKLTKLNKLEAVNAGAGPGLVIPAKVRQMLGELDPNKMDGHQMVITLEDKNGQAIATGHGPGLWSLDDVDFDAVTEAAEAGRMVHRIKLEIN